VGVGSEKTVKQAGTGKVRSKGSDPLYPGPAKREEAEGGALKQKKRDGIVSKRGGASSDRRLRAQGKESIKSKKLFRSLGPSVGGSRKKRGWKKGRGGGKLKNKRKYAFSDRTGKI